MSDKKVLITGSSSFIFSNFIRYLLKDGNQYKIVGVDKISSSLALHSLYVNKSQTTYIADITDQHIFDRIVEYEKPNIIIHAAAHTSVDEALTNPKDYIYNNVYGTQIVIDTAVKHKIPKFIYISSDEVLGDLKSESDDSWTENDPIRPNNIYSASKASGEHIVSSYGKCYNIDYNIIRMSNNYGQRQTLNKFIPKAIKSLSEGKKIPIYGQGREIRDWLFVMDSCSGILKILEAGKPQEIYNIGANQEYSNLEVANMICKAMKKELEVEFIEQRKAHDFRYSLNSDKLKGLGWSPKYKFKETLPNVVEWYILNKYWLK